MHNRATMKRRLCAIGFLVLAASSADAALVSRMSGQAYYDDALDITWLADANYAQTSGYDADGLMTWPAAQDWITSLNAANHLGANGWRLPRVVDTGDPGCIVAYTGTDCGYNVDLATGEMAHLFYGTLGNTAYYDVNGMATGCSGVSPYCLTNPGPFSNLQPHFYWTGTEVALHGSDSWYFRFAYGSQNYSQRSNEYYAWPVLDGDIGAVPEPAAVLQFPAALSVLVWLRRSIGGAKATRESVDRRIPV